MSRWPAAVGRFGYEFLIGDTPELAAGVALVIVGAQPRSWCGDLLVHSGGGGSASDSEPLAGHLQSPGLARSVTRGDVQPRGPATHRSCGLGAPNGLDVGELPHAEVVQLPADTAPLNSSEG